MRRIAFWPMATILMLGACKQTVAPEASGPATPAGESLVAPAAGARLDGARVTATRCGIAGLGQDHLRSMQADRQGHLYVFDDSNRPHKISRGDGPCGLAAAGRIEGGDYAFGPDGAVAPARGEGSGCQSARFSAFAWKGAVAGGKAYVRVDSGRSVHVEPLGAADCQPAPFTQQAPEGRVSDLAVSDAHVLLLEFHGSGHAKNAVWRYRLDGSLVDQVGLKEGGGTHLGWPDEVSTCADGVCVAASGKLLVFDGAGGLRASHALAPMLPALKALEVVDLVEAGGRLYALMSFKTEAGEKAADVVRLDGVLMGG
jgi:hypothetical protein